MINVLRIVTQESAKDMTAVMAGAQSLTRSAVYGFILGDSGRAAALELHSATWSLHEFLNLRTHIPAGPRAASGEFGQYAAFLDSRNESQTESNYRIPLRRERRLNEIGP